MKKGFWASDWFAAIAFSAVFLGLAQLVIPDSFDALERYTYDLGVKANGRAPSDRIAIVAIDDDSIERIGRYPWPRAVHANMLDKLDKSGAKVITSAIFFSESEDEPGLDALNQVSDYLESSILSKQFPARIKSIDGAITQVEALGRRVDALELDADDKPDLKSIGALRQIWRSADLENELSTELTELQNLLDSARTGLSNDDSLSVAMKRYGRSLLPMMFSPGYPEGNPDEALPDYVKRYSLTNIVDRVDAIANQVFPVPTVSADLLPVPAMGTAAAGLGHLVTLLDADGTVRNEPLVILYYEELYPSLSLMTAATALNLGPEDIEVRLGEGIQLGGITLETTSSLRMRSQFYGDRDGRPAFPVYSFFDVQEGKIQANALKDKIILIGATATGTADALSTPVSSSMPPVMVLAHTVSSILEGHYFTEPTWGYAAGLGVIALAVLYLAFVLPLLTPAIGLIVSLLLVISLLATEFVLLSSNALWLQLTLPAVLLATGFLFLTVKKLRLTERLRLSSDMESGESNRMLGLAFQGQGQLDMAFEKFRRVKPVDEKVLELVYNLALDFERKRQFGKAESAYKYIAEHEAGYKDVKQKLARAQKLSETVIMGGDSSFTSGGTLVMGIDDNIEKPMLGRYQVEKELGKGAMGVVYLGKDPKIGRMVAIKTMSLSAEVPEEELGEVRERFFREAEAAGNLSHPHIVQIFDAGEEHDLAYIAMEFIKGHDLVQHTKPDQLLPLEETLKYIADAADGLGYAHARNVVHRDIKPANLMLLAETKTIKVTDFGVARLTDASKTKTGMVLGTPSFMSPEQLQGAKVDGRTDIFSLGVTLYQLLTGKLPFVADSIATLMFKIASEPHPQITETRADLPEQLNTIINKALEKKLDQRYQTSNELAADLRELLATMKQSS